MSVAPVFARAEDPVAVSGQPRHGSGASRIGAPRTDPPAHPPRAAAIAVRTQRARAGASLIRCSTVLEISDG